MRNNHCFLILIFSLPFVGVRLAAETAAERWGRAQTQYNSYDAQRESRERNKPGYSNMSTPQTSAPVYDNTPRSGSEVAAEHERVMEAMRQKWADIEARQKQQREMAEAKAQAAAEVERKRYEARAAKKYNKMVDKAVSMVLEPDEKWNAFINSLTQDEQEYVRNGYQRSFYWHSPLADAAQDYLKGKRKPKKGTAVDAARQIYKRGTEIYDLWCAHDWGLLELAQDPQAGETKMVTLYAEQLTALEERNKKINMGLKSVWPDGMAYFPMMFKVIRAYFYGWGVPVDLEKAQPFVKKMEFSYGILWGDLDVRTVDKTDPAKRHLWVDAQALQAEMRALGFGFGGIPNPKYGREWIRRAFETIEGQPDLYTIDDKLSLLLTLSSFDGDLDNKELSFNIVKEGYDHNPLLAGGEYVYKLLKGDGAPANPEEAYKIATDLPAMEPKALSRVVRLWLGNDGVARDTAKAKELLDRFSDPANPEHARLSQEVLAPPAAATPL